jgi:hypothetical protein
MYKIIKGECPNQKNAIIEVEYTDASTCTSKIYIRGRYTCNYGGACDLKCPLYEKAPK